MATIACNTRLCILLISSALNSNGSPLVAWRVKLKSESLIVNMIHSDHDVMKSPILEQIADGLNKLGRRGSTLLKDFIEVEYMDLSDEEVPVGLEEPGLHEVAGFGSLVLELPTPPREEPRPEVGFTERSAKDDYDHVYKW